MSTTPVRIRRYPNRRLYDRQSSRYLSLADIDALVQSGRTVEIRDSQTGEDLTRTVLARIIMDRQPEKMRLFPKDMLHLILRSNEVTTELLHDYFRDSLSYLEQLQRDATRAGSLGASLEWVRSWLQRPGPPDARHAPPEGDPPLSKRVEQLEERIRKMEAQAS